MDVRRWMVAGLLGVMFLAVFGTARAEAQGFTITAVSCRGEYVDVKNTFPQTRDLEGFRLFDHGRRHGFTYPSVLLPAGVRVRVWADGKTGGPIPRSFTGWGGTVWNDTGDQASLVNPNGTVVAKRNCGDVGGPRPPAGRNCHPSYTPCIAPGSSDVDCLPGSGNGPRFVHGPVQVHGPDQYGLDGNHDGVGCEG
jgi:hypothetical protein